MMKMAQLKKNRDLIDAIDWDMTHEEAVRLYLEWGNNWARGSYVIRSKNDESHYFVVNTWGDIPKIYLVKRNSELAEELAEIDMAGEVRDDFLNQIGHQKGVYSITGGVKKWLKKELQ